MTQTPIPNDWIILFKSHSIFLFSNSKVGHPRLWIIRGKEHLITNMFKEKY